MRVARRRIGVLAEDHHLHGVERRQKQRIEDGLGRRQHLLAGGDAGIDLRGDALGRAVGEERQRPPACRIRVVAERGQRRRGRPLVPHLVPPLGPHATLEFLQTPSRFR